MTILASMRQTKYSKTVLTAQKQNSKRKGNFACQSSKLIESTFQKYWAQVIIVKYLIHSYRDVLGFAHIIDTHILPEQLKKILFRK